MSQAARGGTGSPSSADVIARRTCACANRYCRHHQALRASLEPEVRAGTVSCWRCAGKIHPEDDWDLGHDDDDPRAYRGAEHVKCNRATAGRAQTPRRWTL